MLHICIAAIINLSFTYFISSLQFNRAGLFQATEESFIPKAGKKGEHK